MSALTEEDDGAYGTFRLADTDRAREARSLAADGILTGLSVGFTGIEARAGKGSRTHTKANLMEVSLVTFPAYAQAGVLAVRQEERMEEPVNEEIVEEVSTETLDLAPLNARMEEHSVELREVRNEIANYLHRPSRSGSADDPAPGVRHHPANGRRPAEAELRSR